MGFQQACFLPLPVIFLQAPTAKLPAPTAGQLQDSAWEQVTRHGTRYLGVGFTSDVGGLIWNLGQSWELWPLKHQSVQNSDATRG